MPVIAKAAICRGREYPFTIEDVVLDELRPEELRVRIVASGICHTDLAVRDQHLPVPLPAVLGHEGAGIVEEVGSAVTVAKPGDRVVMSFNSCGQCPSCDAEMPTYCYEFFLYNWHGARPDDSKTLTKSDGDINASFFGQSSFASYAIANELNVAKVPEAAKDIPLEQMAPIGCGLMTGAGAVLRSMKVREGMPFAVTGAGTVGMAAIMAAKIVGANPIIAVDVNDDRLELAKELGASHALNAENDAISQIAELCPKGLAYGFDTTGLRTVIQDLFSLLPPKGILGIVGASGPEEILEFPEFEFMGGGRTVMGILGGDSNIEEFISELIAYNLEGKFPFEKLITYFDFEQINEAIAASENGSVVKPVLRIGQE